MTKNQKMLLGVGAVAVVGYLVYKQMNSKVKGGVAPQPAGTATFASATGGMFGKRPPKTVYGDCGAVYNGYQAVYPVGLHPETCAVTQFYCCDPKICGTSQFSSLGIVLPS